MDYACDLHLHSCLSPCGEEEMTPANLVNMAALLGLDIIALTDHNTVGNCAAAMAAGEAAGVLVLPGMELCTAEEIHVVCLFGELESARGFAARVYETLPPIENRPEIYGRQLLMDEGDTILGEEPLLLVTASGISIDDAPPLVERFGGVCFPAHIDRPSFSVLATLGAFPHWLPFSCAEVTGQAHRQELLRQHPHLENLRLLRASDAHCLGDMTEGEQAQKAPLPRRSAEALLAWLKSPAGSP